MSFARFYRHNTEIHDIDTSSTWIYSIIFLRILYFQLTGCAKVSWRATELFQQNSQPQRIKVFFVYNGWMPFSQIFYVYMVLYIRTVPDIFCGLTYFASFSAALCSLPVTTSGITIEIRQCQTSVWPNLYDVRCMWRVRPRCDRDWPRIAFARSIWLEHTA